MFNFDQLKSVQTVCAALGNRLSLACEFWHPGPQDYDGEEWKSTWQCHLSPTSCWRHPPLADSESPSACLPSPAAHPPIRPGTSLPMLTSLARSHTCAQGGGSPNEEAQGSCCCRHFFLSQQNEACSSLTCRASPTTTALQGSL